MPCAGVALALAVVAGCGNSGSGTSSGPGAGRVTFPPIAADIPTRPPNIVVVMTDDQRADDLSVMPTVEDQLVAKGTSFANNFATYPLCCPSRTTFMTGEYAHNHGILTNDPPDGAYAGFMSHVPPGRTIGVRLQRAGYRTGYVGKFLNDYNPPSPNEVPPGWNTFDGLYGVSEYAMFNYSMNENGTTATFGSSPRDYKTDVLTRMATRFIRTNAGHEPFFLTYAPVAPHNAPSVPGSRNPQPAPRDATAFLHRPFPRSPSFNRAISGQSPRLRPKPLTHAEVRATVAAYRDRLATLRAVDRGVGHLLATLRHQGVLGNTLIIYTSDNGFLLGEHRELGKERPYEESAKVPLVVRGPGFPAGITRRQLVGNIDLFPTIISEAGAPWRANTDGVSLLAQANDPAAWSERPILFEGNAAEGRGYHTIRTPRYSYTHYLNGAQELFDLSQDPDELHNVVHDPAYANTLTALRPLSKALAHCAGNQCRRPLPVIPGPSG